MDIRFKSCKYLMNSIHFVYTILLVVIILSGCTVETDVETGKLNSVRNQSLEYEQIKKTTIRKILFDS